MTDVDISTKKCSKCQNFLSTVLFNKNKAKRDGLSTECKACVKANSAETYAKNAEVRRAKMRQDYQNNKDAYKARARKWELENPERKKELRADYRRDNTEKIKEFSRRDWQRHGDKRRAKNKEYRKNNPERGMEHVRARQTRKQRAMPAWADRAAILEIYRECARISKETGVKHHVDHYYPLVNDIVCGLHVVYNLRIIPAHANQSKANKFPEELTCPA